MNSDIIRTILFSKLILMTFVYCFIVNTLHKLLEKNNPFSEMIMSQTLAVVTSEYILIECVFLTLNDCFIALKYFPCY